MIREVGAGIWSDTDAPHDAVVIETDDRGYREYYAQPFLAFGLLGEGLWGEVLDEIGRDCPDGTYPIPQRYIRQLLPDTVRALRLLEPGYSQVCQVPMCAQDANSMVAGYSLCPLHADDVTEFGRYLASSNSEAPT